MTSLRTWLSGGAVVALVAGSAMLGPAVAFADETAPAPAATEAAAPEAVADVAPLDVDVAAFGQEIGRAAADGNETYTISPKGPWKGGQKVTITAKGWAPNNLVVVLTCPNKANTNTSKYFVPAGNPPGGGCGAYTAPGGAIGPATDGTATFTVTIPEGKLVPADTALPISCVKNGDCTIAVYGTDKDMMKALIKGPPTPITYVGQSSGGSSSGGGSTSGGSTSGGSTTNSAGGSSSGGSTASGGGTSSTNGGTELANTGSTSSSTAFAGLGIIVLGAFLALAARRIPSTQESTH